MTDASVLEGVRTPGGRYGGSLAHIRTDDLLGQTMVWACESVAVDLDRIEDIAAGARERRARMRTCSSRCTAETAPPAWHRRTRDRHQVTESELERANDRSGDGPAACDV
jgi:acetyl-CoA acetyltransferase